MWFLEHGRELTLQELVSPTGFHSPGYIEKSVSCSWSLWRQYYRLVQLSCQRQRIFWEISQEKLTISRASGINIGIGWDAWMWKQLAQDCVQTAWQPQKEAQVRAFINARALYRPILRVLRSSRGQKKVSMLLGGIKTVGSILRYIHHQFSSKKRIWLSLVLLAWQRTASQSTIKQMRRKHMQQSSQDVQVTY